MAPFEISPTNYILFPLLYPEFSCWSFPWYFLIRNIFREFITKNINSIHLKFTPIPAFICMSPPIHSLCFRKHYFSFLCGFPEFHYIIHSFIHFLHVYVSLHKIEYHSKCFLNFINYFYTISFLFSKLYLWDPYTFILLNLIHSFSLLYSTPVSKYATF